jgi:hypothetical protein
MVLFTDNEISFDEFYKFYILSILLLTFYTSNVYQ